MHVCLRIKPIPSSCKCHYSDLKKEEEVFRDEILAIQLRDYSFYGTENISVSPNGEGRWLIENRSNDAKLTVGSGLIDVLQDIVTNQRYTKPPGPQTAVNDSIARFLTYLHRQGFLKARLKDASVPSALLRV